MLVVRIVSVLLALCCAAGAKADELSIHQRSHEIYCLARVVYGEVRNRSALEQRVVALSVMNRVKLNRPDFGGNTVCGVAFFAVKRLDGALVKQYSSIEGSELDDWHPAKPGDWPSWDRALRAASDVYNERMVAHGSMRHALYYLNPRHASHNSKRWFAKHLRPIKLAGTFAHRFFAER